MADLVPPSMEAVVDELGRPTAQFFQWLQLATALDPIVGDGSPEGTVEARQKRFYWDETAGALYFKAQNSIGADRKLGWVAV